MKLPFRFDLFMVMCSLMFVIILQIELIEGMNETKTNLKQGSYNY